MNEAKTIATKQGHNYAAEEALKRILTDGLTQANEAFAKEVYEGLSKRNARVLADRAKKQAETPPPAPPGF